MNFIRDEFFTEPFYFGTGIFNVLVLEDPKFMRRFYLRIGAQVEGESDYFQYSENGARKELSKDAYLISSPFSMELDEKKLSLSIIKELEKKISEDKREQMAALNQRMTDFIKDLVYDYPLHLEFNDENTVSSLLKMAELRIDFDGDDPVENFMLKIKAVAYLLGKKILICFGMHDFFSTEELEMIYSNLSLLHLDLISVESHEPSTKLPNEKIFIIDKDLCEVIK